MRNFDIFVQHLFFWGGGNVSAPPPFTPMFKASRCWLQFYFIFSSGFFVVTTRIKYSNNALSKGEKHTSRLMLKTITKIHY